MKQMETNTTLYYDKEVEKHLKDLLERILHQMENFIETKEDLKTVESELKDYENVTALIDIIKAIFTNLMNKIDKKLQKLQRQVERYTDPLKTSKSLKEEEEYEKLEQTVIKYEGEIRTHIRVEQQLKLYAESIQNRLDESEELRNQILIQTKNTINNLKKDNQKLNEQSLSSQQEIKQLQSRIKQLEQESIKKSIDSDKLEQHIQFLKQQPQQIKQVLQQKPSKINKQSSSFSEHKLTTHITHGDNNNNNNQQESTDIPTQSQASIKQNFFNVISYHGPQQQSQSQHQSSIQQNDTLKSLNDLSKLYGQMLKGKHHSVSAIKDSSKDSKTNQSTAKMPSQNSSIVYKLKFDTLVGRSRSNSSKRPQQVSNSKTLNK